MRRHRSIARKRSFSPVPKLSHRLGKALAALACVIVLGPILLQGEVLYPHDNSLEVGASSVSSPQSDQNRKFSDVSSVYIPALMHQLSSDSVGWIATWNPATELGRPAMHVSGLSKAFPFTLALSWVQQDALTLYTWLGILALCLSVGFAYLLLEAHDLDPAACLFGAVFLGLGTFPLYWMSFVMFLWSITWTLALLLLVRLTCRGAADRLSRATLGMGVAFASYALILSGYPQQTIWNGLFLTGYAIVEITRASQKTAAPDLKSRLRYATGIALPLGIGLMLGLLAAAPVLIDLLEISAASARGSAEVGFFQRVLTPTPDLRSAAAFATRLFDAWIWGNPMDQSYPHAFNGLSWSPIVACLVASSFAWSRGASFWWSQLFIVVALIASVSKPAFALLWTTGLFSLSRFHPLAGAFVPTILLAAFCADAFLRMGPQRRVLALALPFPFAVVAISGALNAKASLDPIYAAQSALVLFGTLAFILFRKRAILVALTIACVGLYSVRMPLTRPADEIRMTSPLVEMIRQGTPPGMRIAWVAKRENVPIPPNQETQLGLRSIHSYNSLSSKKYQRWVQRLSPKGTRTLGRLFTSIEDPNRLIGNPELEFAGIGLFLSLVRMHPSVARAGAPNSLAYRPIERPYLEAQVSQYSEFADGEVQIPSPLHKAGLLPVHRSEDFDDRLEFETSPVAQETILFVSQEHHLHWRATRDGESLETVLVNGFYQGVLLPPNTSQVELQYLSAVRFSWIPELAFVFAGGLLLVLRLRGPAWSKSRAATQ